MSPVDPQSGKLQSSETQSANLPVSENHQTSATHRPAQFFGYQTMGVAPAMGIRDLYRRFRGRRKSG